METTAMTGLRLAAASAIVALCAVSTAHAAPQKLVSGQTLSLPLTEDSDGPALKFVIAKAVLTGSPYQGTAPVAGETPAERKARANELVLDNIEGRNLVAFVRYAADDLRGRYAEFARPVTVSASFADAMKVDQAALMGDSLKAGFTFGIGAPSTTPIVYYAHMDLTIDGPDGVSQSFSCDVQEPGRVPMPTRKPNPHAHDELDRMADVSRKACFAQIVVKLNGAAAPSVAAVTPPIQN